MVLLKDVVREGRVTPTNRDRKGARRSHPRAAWCALAFRSTAGAHRRPVERVTTKIRPLLSGRSRKARELARVPQSEVIRTGASSKPAFRSWPSDTRTLPIGSHAPEWVVPLVPDELEFWQGRTPDCTTRRYRGRGRVRIERLAP